MLNMSDRRHSHTPLPPSYGPNRLLNILIATLLTVMITLLIIFALSLSI